MAPDRPGSQPKPTMEWLVNSTHNVVSDTFNLLYESYPPTVVLQGLTKRKKPVVVHLTTVPRVGETLWYGRPRQTGHGKYTVVEVEWFAAQQGFQGEVGYAVVHVEPMRKPTARQSS